MLAAIILSSTVSEARLRNKYDWCAFERVKTYRYQSKVTKWVALREKCEQEAITDRHKTCFWEIKISSRYEKKLEKWMDRQQMCELRMPTPLACEAIYCKKD